MVLLIIIQLSLLNGYFIGNIPYFQTNPYISIYLSTMCVIGNEWNEWTISIGNASRGVQHLPRDGPRLSRSDQIWKISNIGIIGPSSERFLVADLILLYFLYCIIRCIYIYMFHLFIGKNSVSSSPNFGIFWHSWLTKQYNTMQSTDSWFQKFENWIARSNHLWISMVSLPEAPIFCFGPWPLAPQGGLWSFSSLSSFHSLVSSKVTKS